ncbi:MAG: RIP metalloprotease RseP, partial [SAR324 cluster bacterium]|nr:RIP metalloprotease RseP [SAR324 cluster bacterium]
MLTIVVSVLSGILVLGVLILIHELGHYLAARHVGVRVERFSIGFPPKAIGKRIGETEYVLSWTPIGGYVKLYGQNIDDENPSDPRNYAAKSKLQRAYILLAGPAMNLLGAVLLMTLVYMLGVETPSFRLSQPHIAQVAEDSPAQRAGFQPGDQIVRLGETEITSWNDLDDAIEQAVIHGQVLRFTVQRQGREHALAVGHLPFASGKDFGWRPVIPAVVGGFGDDSPARAAGMEVGDRIVAIDGKPVQSFGEVRSAIQQAQGQPEAFPAQGQPLAFRVEREGTELTFTVTPRFDEPRERWMIGIATG